MKKTSVVLNALILLLAVIMAVSCGKGKSKNPVDPSEDETYAIKGMVKEGSSGLAGVSVHIVSNNVNKTGMTSSDGAYTFKDLTDGIYTITPEKSGYTFKPPTVMIVISGSAREVEDIIAAKAGTVYAISGKILEGDSGLAGVFIRLTGDGVNQTTTTDSSGEYSFSGLVNGVYAIVPSKSGYKFKPDSPLVTVRSSNKVADTIIASKLGSGYTISGSFREGDSGLSGVTVRLVGNGEEQIALTNFNGAYAFPDLENGVYTINFWKDVLSLTARYVFSPLSVEVTVNGADVKVADISATYQDDSHPVSDIIFVSIPGGTFQMGDIEDGGEPDEKPVHTVRLSSFEMSIYKVTNAQYAKYLNEALKTGDVKVVSLLTKKSVRGGKGEYYEYLYLEMSGSYDSDNKCWISYNDNDSTFSVASGKENWPVVFVTWFGSKSFAFYYGLDLPTESEWEYACRGGKQYKYGTDNGAISTSKANYKDSGIGHPAEVGSYPANPFGLYDMSGNVFEWCHDLYGTYPSESALDPEGAFRGGSRVCRGGGWALDASFCRSASRDYSSSDVLDSPNLGFRVVRRMFGWQR